MSESAFRDYAESKGFHPQTLKRWLDWPAADRLALAELAMALKIGDNQLRDFMDWCEEIGLRDGVTMAALLTGKAVDDIATDPRLGRADRVKKIKEWLRRLRFPRLAQTEDEIHGQIRALKLQPEIRVSVPPGLEGGRLEIHFSVTNQEDFKRLAKKLSAAADSGASGEIFALLGGAASRNESA